MCVVQRTEARYADTYAHTIYEDIARLANTTYHPPRLLLPCQQHAARLDSRDYSCRPCGRLRQNHLRWRQRGALLVGTAMLSR